MLHENLKYVYGVYTEITFLHKLNQVPRNNQ